MTEIPQGTTTAPVTVRSPAGVTVSGVTVSGLIRGWETATIVCAGLAALGALTAACCRKSQ